VYPNIFQSGASTGSSFTAFGTKYSLPIGTIREDEKEFEEFIIPKCEKHPIRDTETPVKISALESWAQQAFTGYSCLNRIQSIVYPIAFNTNENMLVCAPTGAVKRV
jgi:hypothetical protein